MAVPELLAVVENWICCVWRGHVGRCLLVECFYGNGRYYMGSAWRVGGCGLEGGERREGERGGRGREEGGGERREGERGGRQ